MSHEQLAHMRRSYTKQGLLEEQAPSEPYALFRLWFEHAMKTEQPPVEPNAMTLATVDGKGKPHCRVLLLKALDEHGFVFYTNYMSAKGQELANNSYAAMTFFWPALERQVRIEGSTERVTAAESDAYFQMRPLGSRIGAWASEQSEVLSSRVQLDECMERAQQRFVNSQPPRPEHWGGYRLLAERIEFWQGRPDRLHDRLDYLRQANGEWLRQRLAP